MSSRVKNRHRLKRKEIQRLSQRLSDQYGDSFIDEEMTVEMGRLEDGSDVILVDNEVDFVSAGQEGWMFTLLGIYKFRPKRSYVVVDMGAIRFVTNGADIMAPGITDADEDISEGEFVWVCDENNRKPLAVGRALMSGEDMVRGTGGKAIENIHYVGDALWNMVSCDD